MKNRTYDNIGTRLAIHKNDSLHEHSQPYDITGGVAHCLKSANNSTLSAINC